ncbi:hypothetical protein QCM80_43130 [Bradyrhizobium sp. SSUT112]|uniref:hypothetical protein n=1 Tax=Bradyrhizobium sp. SSUT112 TaxID=3040604 RepID=UPI002447B6FF|nr:hypothetical protein [Bradyrhizobium sp. SSUT112]MDH2357307.1 hypothetical protein [Bradyrhizobium sp. SSUT112]
MIALREAPAHEHSQRLITGSNRPHVFVDQLRHCALGDGPVIGVFVRDGSRSADAATMLVAPVSLLVLGIVGSSKSQSATGPTGLWFARNTSTRAAHSRHNGSLERLFAV